MRKLVFTLLITALIASCSAQSQNDFYGKWIYASEGLAGGTMEYEISAKTFTSTWTPNSSYMFSVEKNTFEIFSWEKIKNENADTAKDYPTGYLVGLRSNIGNTTAKLFINRDKYSLINAYENKGVIIQEVYIKPFAQSDFYGTWEWKQRFKDGTIGNYRHSFSETTFTMSRHDGDTLKYKYDDKIISWKAIVNTDSETKKDYPAGFLIITRSDKANSGSDDKQYLYLHRDKKSVLESEDLTQNKTYFVKTK